MIQRTAKSDTLPITLDAIKAHCRIVGTDDDTYLTELIWCASDYLEYHSDRCFVQGTWVETFNRFPYCRNKIELSQSPLISVASITYYDTDNEQQTVDSDNYTVKTPYSINGYITPVANVEWPATNQELDNIEITYTAGGVPKLFQHGIRLLVAHWWEHRESNIEVSLTVNAHGVAEIVNLLRAGKYHGL